MFGGCWPGGYRVQDPSLAFPVRMTKRMRNSILWWVRRLTSIESSHISNPKTLQNIIQLRSTTKKTNLTLPLAPLEMLESSIHDHASRKVITRCQWLPTACAWIKAPQGDSVDDSDSAHDHQLSLVVYPIIYRVFIHRTGGWEWDFWTINSIEKFDDPRILRRPVNCIRLSSSLGYHPPHPVDPFYNTFLLSNERCQLQVQRVALAFLPAKGRRKFTQNPLLGSLRIWWVVCRCSINWLRIYHDRTWDEPNSY